MVTAGTVAFSDSGSAGYLQISGAGLTVAAGSTMYLVGANSLFFDLGIRPATISGTVVVREGPHRITSEFPEGIKILAGGRVEARAGFTGNLFGTGSGGLGIANSVRFFDGSVYVQAAGANPFALTPPQSVVKFDHGSRYRLEGGTPSASGRTYADFEHFLAGSTTMAGSAAVTMDRAPPWLPPVTARLTPSHFGWLVKKSLALTQPR